MFTNQECVQEVCGDKFSAMFVMMSNHAGELLTRLVGAYKWVLIACTADGPDSGWDCRSDHMPQNPGHPLFFQTSSPHTATPRHCGGKLIATPSRHVRPFAPVFVSLASARAVFTGFFPGHKLPSEKKVRSLQSGWNLTPIHYRRPERPLSVAAQLRPDEPAPAFGTAV